MKRALAAVPVVAILTAGGCDSILEVLDTVTHVEDEHIEYPRWLEDGSVAVGVTNAHFPWSGTVHPESWALDEGGRFVAPFDLTFDLSRAAAFEHEIDTVYAVLVGEPVAHADGRPTGFTGITVTTRFTAVGVPLESYQGTLPVRGLGSDRGSPFEHVVAFDRDALGGGDLARPLTLRGTFEVPMDPAIPEGWYRPHVELFVGFKGRKKVVDSRHLAVTLNTWIDEAARSLSPGGALPSPLNEVDVEEFMKNEQVLPDVKVGDPAERRLVLTLFGDVAAHGQAHLLADEDEAHVGISNRSRFPTPFVLPPGQVTTVPGMPASFPATGLAGLFQGSGSIASEVQSWLDLDSGWFTMTVTGPDGRRLDLGRLEVAATDESGLVLLAAGEVLTDDFEEGPDGRIRGRRFEVPMTVTGRYEAELRGCFEDVLGRSLCGGGTYDWTVALPMSFSTAVKPGTNFLVGGRYPAVLDINPAVAADVRVDLRYLPGGDVDRAQDIVIEGTATRFGYFAPDVWPPRFEEPGEYSALLTVSWKDQAGNLWMGSQASAGVVAPAEPDERELTAHGTRTFLFSPHPDKPWYGSLDRYDLPYEGGSSFAIHSALSLYDHTFPYWSGDTLHVPTTYPLESVIGPTLSMSAQSDRVRSLLERAYMPDGPAPPYLLAPRRRTLTEFPFLEKPAEDNFSYFFVEPGVMQGLPIRSVHRDRLNPYAWPEGNTIEAYAYMSVIRPGLPVLSMAFEYTFMAPCWIISPNDYGYRFHSSPNGDLPEDIYRVMAGVVLKDRTTGEAWFDAYSSAIRITEPGAGFTAVTAPGERPITDNGPREHFMFLGLNTSGVFAVGHELLLGGTLMPPAPANVEVEIKWPSGRTETMAGRANRLGGFSPPRPIVMDEPGVYEVDLDIHRTNADGAEVRGDVVGSGDGRIYYFALPEDSERVMASPLPAFSRVRDAGRIELPLSWASDLENPRLYWSFMTPGSLFDEGAIDLEGDGFDFVFRSRQAGIQLSNLDTVNYGTGDPLLTDIMVFVFFLEAERDGVPVYDALRLVMRGDVLINPDALVRPELIRGATRQVGEGPSYPAQYPVESVRRSTDLDDRSVYYREALPEPPGAGRSKAIGVGVQRPSGDE